MSTIPSRRQSVVEVSLATQQSQLGRATAAPARELWNELAEHHLVSLSMSTHQEAITSKVKKTAGELFHHGWKVNPIDCRVVQVTVR